MQDRDENELDDSTENRKPRAIAWSVELTRGSRRDRVRRVTGRGAVIYSKIKIAGHPVLVAFPVVCYTGTLVAFAVYGANGHLFWLNLGIALSVAGVRGAGPGRGPRAGGRRV